MNAVVTQAAQKYGVPPGILNGVWGMETSWGQNVTTSSAGAEGNFQFIPSTGASYHYPMTNSPDASQFAQQADSAAHYLSDLYKQHGGNWDAALRAYSGGGYGLAEVQAKSQGGSTSGGPSSSSGGSVGSSLGDLTSMLPAVFSPLILVGIVGAFLLGSALFLVW